jgi:pyruvate dehydrogenase E2 component (dihydrolipoamide acetyltransferase)
VNVGVEVIAGDGLLFPTIFDADTKDAAAIAAEREQLEARARDGSITPPELAGATFTIAGPLPGVRARNAILIPPQAAILALGASGAAGMELSLTCDQRIVQPQHAAAFLADLGELLGTGAG